MPSASEYREEWTKISGHASYSYGGLWMDYCISVGLLTEEDARRSSWSWEMALTLAKQHPDALLRWKTLERMGIRAPEL